MTLDPRPSDAELIALAERRVKKSSRMTGLRTPINMNLVRKSPRGNGEKEKRLRAQERSERARAVAVQFTILCQASGLPAPVREHMFAAPLRRWRADYAWESERVLLEVEGAIWSGGRHTRGSGYLADMEKYNYATVHGWKLLRCTPQTLCTDGTIRMLREVMSGKADKDNPRVEIVAAALDAE